MDFFVKQGKKLLISLMIAFMVVTNLPTLTHAAGDGEEVVNQETKEVVNEQNKETEEILEKEEVSEVFEEEEKEENIQQEEINENIIEEEQVEETIEDTVTMPKMAMLTAAPILTTADSTPNYEITYGESGEFKLKEKVDKTISSIEGIEYISGSASVASVTSYEDKWSQKWIKYTGVDYNGGNNVVKVKVKYKYPISKNATYEMKVTVNQRSIPEPTVTYTESSPANYTGNTITNSIVLYDSGLGRNLTSSEYEVTGDTQAKDPGTYTITIKGKGNFTGEKTVKWKISADFANADVTTKENKFYYTGEEIKPEVIVKWGNNTIDSSKYNVTYNGERINAGTYSLTITPKSGTGFTGSKTINFNISKIEDGVTISKNTLTYNGSNQELIKVDKNIGNRTIYYYQSSYGFNTREGLIAASNGKWTTNKPTGKDAGTYHVYWKADGNNNCEEISTYVSNHFEVTIAQKSIVGLATVNKSTEGYEYTGSKQKVSLNTSLTEGKDNDYVLSGTYEATEPGTYTFSVTGKGNYTGTETLTWKINQSKDLSTATITLSKSELSYNGKQQAPTVTNVTIGGETVDSGNYSVDVTKGTDVGEYSVTIKPSTAGGTNGYYGQKTTTYKIVKGSKLVSVNAVSLTYTGYNLNLVTTNNPGNQTIYYFVSETDYSSDAELDLGLIAGGGWSTNIPTEQDAGTYYVYWKADGNNNCEAIDKYHGRRAVVKINKRNINDASFTVNYAGEDGLEKSAKDYIVVKYNSVTLTSEDITIEDVKGTSAGTYKTKVTGKGNFTGEKTVDFVISQKNNTATVNKKASITYNRSNQTLLDSVTSTYGTVEYKLGDNGSWSTSIPSAKNAGNYTVYYRVQSGYDSKDQVNYNAIYGSVNVTIDKKNLSSSDIVVNITSDLTYNGYSQLVTYTVKDNGTELDLLTEYVVNSGSTGKSAGTHTIEFEGRGNYTGTKSQEWTIKAVDINNGSITITSTDLVYNGSKQEVEFKVYFNLKELDLNEDYEIVDETNKATDAGNHTLKIKGIGDYTGESTKTFTIEQAYIKVDGNKISVTNSAFTANSLTYSGEEQTSLTQKNNIVGLDNKVIEYRVNEGTWSTSIPKLKDAGVYKVGYRITTESGKYSNYKDYGDNIAEPIIVTVLPKKLNNDDFKIEPSSTVFTGKEITAVVKPVKVEATEGVDYNIINKAALTKTEPGTYTVVLTTIASNSGNFTNEAFNLTYDWTIEKKDIDQTFNVEFYSALYTGESINVKDYVKEIKYNDITLTTNDYEITDTHTDKGTYDVTIKGKGDRFKGSYTFSDKFVVTDADLELSATAYSGTYDTNSYDAISGVTVKTADTKAVVNGMKIKYSIDNGTTWSDSIPSIKNAGTYTVLYRVFEGKDSGGTYHVGCIGKIENIVINQASITKIEITQNSYTYNGFKKTIEYKVYAGSIELSSTDYTLVGYTSATDAPNVEYKNTTLDMKEYCSNDKYSFKVTGKGNFKDSKTGEWTINSVSIDNAVITQGILPIVYDGNSHTINITSVIANLLVADYDVECIAQTDAGSYSATVKGKGNFKGQKTVDWTIEQADIQVNGKPISHLNRPIEAKTLIYNTEDQELIKLKDNLEMVGASKTTPIRYSFDKTNWTYDISEITKKGAGTYRVYYQVYGTKNYKNYGFLIEDFVDVIIAPVKLTALNFEVKLTNSMIEEGDVTYDLLGTHVGYNGEKVNAELVGTYKYPDPKKPGEYKTYTLEVNKDYTVYSGDTEGTNVGTYNFVVSTIISSNFTDSGIVIAKHWYIDKADTKLNFKEETFTFNGEEQELLHLDETKPCNVKGVEESAYYLISDTPLDEPLNSLGWTNDLSELTRKDAGTYYIYYATPGTDNYKAINSCKEVTIEKLDITDKNIFLTGNALVEKKDNQGNFVKLTQEFVVKLNKDAEEDILNYDDENITISYSDEQNLVYSNQGYENGPYLLGITISENCKNYKGSATKTWAINGSTFNNEEQVKDGTYEIKNVVLDDEQKEVEGTPVAKLETKSQDILSAVASSEEMSEIANGNRLNIILSSTNVEETTVEKEVKKAIEDKAKGLSVASYIDISLFKQLVEVERDIAGEVVKETKGEMVKVTETISKAIKITIPVAEDLINKNTKLNRTYNIVRAHDESGTMSYDILPTTFNEKDKTLTFETDKFSTYAVAYKDEIKQSSPTTKDVTVTEYEAQYYWSKDYSNCTAKYYIKGTNTVIIEEKAPSYIEVIDSTKLKEGYVTYIAYFEEDVFEEQTVIIKLDGTNYPSLEFKQGQSEITGEATLHEGNIHSYIKLVVNDINLRIDKEEANKVVKDVYDIYPFELHLENSNGKKVESRKGNKYGIKLVVPEVINGADNYYLAKVNKDNTLTVVDTKYDATTNSFDFVTEELGNYVIISSKAQEEVVTPVVKEDNHNSTHIIGIIALAILVVLAVIVYIKQIKTLNIITIVLSLFGSIYLALNATCAICYFILAGMIVVIVFSIIGKR